MQRTPPIWVIGAGIAGVSTALRLADRGQSVRIVSKAPLAETASYWAQGGIAAALGPRDNWRLHAQDTEDAGAELCHSAAVTEVTRAAPGAIRRLQALGARFSVTPSGSLHLTQEGGHSRRRIVHADDATGRETMTALLAAAHRHDRIEFVSGYVMELIVGAGRCTGLVLAEQENSVPRAVPASSVVLATGGAASLFATSTNPAGSVGDGIALAFRAGCRVANMEFIQFHPTALVGTGERPFLISEALRGEGAVLKDLSGRPFMSDYDARAELAPRDIVARAIASEMRRGKTDFVHLDISHRDRAFIERHFPNISRHCAQLGLDIASEPLPVAPAAHYTCGGILAGLNGETDVPGLVAIGECAFTGLHGANRLASNSLLEGIALADNVADRLVATLPRSVEANVNDIGETGSRPSISKATAARLRRLLKKTLSDYVGIERSGRGLGKAHRVIDRIRSIAGTHRADAESAALHNMIDVAELIVLSAQNRKESRGGHFNVDYPGQAAAPRDTVLTPPNYRTARRAA